MINSEKKYWDRQANTWIELTEKGLDIFRDYISSPAFFSLLPETKDKFGLDIGCGDGYNTRKLEKKARKLVAVDISHPFVDYANKKKEHNDTSFIQCDAVSLPFQSSSFDFVVSFMAMMS